VVGAAVFLSPVNYSSVVLPLLCCSAMCCTACVLSCLCCVGLLGSSDSEGPARVQAVVTLREVLEDRQWLEVQPWAQKALALEREGQQGAGVFHNRQVHVRASQGFPGLPHVHILSRHQYLPQVRLMSPYTPCTLHPAPCTLHPVPQNAHSTLCTPECTPYTLHPRLCTHY